MVRHFSAGARVVFKKSKSLFLTVAGAAMASMGFPGAAEAQQAAPPKAPTANTAASEEVVVIGARPLAESEAAALKVQRNSDNLVSVLSADGIGRLPDQNIAFAVGRLPGVSLERDQGQARYVTLRGAPTYWTTVSFDGLSVVSPEGRNTRFDNIPSAIASQVIVNKAITANMPGDTVAGNIDIRTRNAFDYKGFTAFGNVGLGKLNLGGGEESDNSLVIANQFFGGKLGAMIQGSFYKRRMVTDNWETDPYLVPGASGTPATPGSRFAREYENKPYRLTRANRSLSTRFDFRPTDDHDIFFSSIWTQYADTELRNNYIFRMDQGTGPTGTSGPAATPGNTPRLGTVFGARINVNLNSLESEEDSYINTLGGTSKFGGWTVDWRANYVFTSDGRDSGALPNWESPSAAADRPTVDYNFTDPDNNTVRLFRTVVAGSTRSKGAAVANIEDFNVPFVNISRREGADETQAYTAKLDIGREVELFGGPVDLKFGGLWTDRTKKSDERTWTATAAQLTAAGVALPTIATFGLNKPYLGDYKLGYNFKYHSKSAIEAFAADLQRRGIATPVDTSGNLWKVGETITAGYLMGTARRDWGSLVVGARVEKIENSGSAFSTIGGVRAFRTINSDETLFYPSAHLNLDLSEEWKLRFGATSTASRPDYDDLRPNLTVNDATRAVSGGNPEAKPEKQIGLDAYAERYMADGGYFSAGLFYKKVSDVLFSYTDVFGSAVLNTPGFDRSGYLFTAVQNGGDGYLWGAEFSYAHSAESWVEASNLPAWIGGFGVKASATVTNTEAKVPAVRGLVGGALTVLVPERTTRLPGASDFTGNLQLTYEKYDLSVRLAYQYRTDFIQSIGGYTVVGGVTVPNGNGDTYWDNDDELDLSVRYRLTKNFELYADAVNLLNGPGRRFVDSKDFPIEYEKFGARYLAGVRFNF
jgi:TonB-dependent receptor